MTSSNSLCKSISAPANIVDRSIHELPDGRSIAYAQTGSGPDCLLIHGTLMTLEDMWLGPTASLTEHFRVTAVDRPGHGLSRRLRLVDASPWRQAAIIHDFALGQGLRAPVVIGHSYGGTVALAYAMLYPEEVTGIVALAPMCLPDPMRPEPVLFGSRSVPVFGERLASMLSLSTDPLMLQILWQAMFLPQRMPEPFAARFPFALAARPKQMIAEGEDAAALSPALFTAAASYADCRVPVRIIGGTADIVVNNAAQGRVAAALLPQASFAWVHNSGHMLHHFVQEKVVDAALSLM